MCVDELATIYVNELKTAVRVNYGYWIGGKIMTKIKIKLNNRFYLTSSPYNPAILVRVALPSDDEDERDVFDRDNRQQWYFQNYSSAIKEYAYQMARIDGNNGDDINDLKTLAKVIDKHLEYAKDKVAQAGEDNDCY